MKCKKCGVDKLSREFPPFTLSNDCDHPPLHCLRCVTSHWSQNKSCSLCNRDVPETALNLKKCQSILEALFPEIHPSVEDADDTACGGSKEITVIRLDGEATVVPYHPATSIFRLKELVKKHMGIAPSNQRLVFNGEEMKDFSPDNIQNKLSTYGVNAGATIHLMVLLCAVPSNLNKVVFDLYWGFPSEGLDYLDASALMFNGKNFVDVADWCKKTKAGGALRHSGDILDEEDEIGHHIINVKLHSMPPHITHVFFTLSAWDSPSISHYKNPSLRFYEESNPGKMLCRDQTKKAGHRQAIVMCSLCKLDGQWFVHDNGALSNGNARQYGPLKRTIRKLITKMGIGNR